MERMTAATDAALLTAFVCHRDEQAFRVLAESHFGLIFHTALRRTGNRALAQDVSQEVLCILARKAAFLSLQPERLPSWLHRTTLFECTTAMRKESSQQRRLERAHLEDTASQPPIVLLEHESSRWQRALPLLDQALQEIPEPDRRIVLLHYFESLSFPRIAALLGRTPAAVQKQSVRALAKLGRALGRRGVTLPAAALAAGLTAESARAVPLSLLPSFTAQALAGSAGVSLTSSLSLMIATHQKILAPVALLLLAVPLALQQVAIANAEQRLSNLTLAPPANTRPAAAKQEAGRTGGTQISTSLQVATLVEEACLAARAKSLEIPLRGKLQALDTRQLSGLLQADNLRAFSYDRGSALATLLADILGSRDRLLAMDGLMDAGWKGTAEPSRQFGLWLDTDPAAAEQWLRHAPQRPEMVALMSHPPRRSPVNPNTSDIPLRGGTTSLSSMQGQLLAYLVSTNPDGARSYLASFPPDTWQPDVIADGLQNFRYRGAHAPENAATYLALIKENLPGDLYPAGLRALVASLGGEEGFRALDALVQVPGQSAGERRQIAALITRTLLKREAQPVYPRPAGSSQPSHETAEQWVTRVVPEQAGSIIDEVAPEVALRLEREEAGLLESLRSLHTTPSNDPDDQMASNLGGRRFIYHFPEALEMAEKIQSPALRAQTLQKLNANAK